MRVSRVEEMRNLDRQAVDLGIAPGILMKNAGNAAYFVIHTEFGIKGKKFTIFCGQGNNGGDGCVVARKLYSNGGTVKVFLLAEMKKFKGHARKNLDILYNIGVEIKYLSSNDQAHEDINNSDAIIDAIFGTGLTRDVREIYRDVIKLINNSGKKVFAIDIPSGVNGNTGQEMGISVSADYTITYGLPKIGNLLYPGYVRCGILYVSHISFPPYIYDSDSLKIEMNPPAKLIERNFDTKESRKALFIAWSEDNYDTAYYSTLSYIKTTGGIAYLASPKSVKPAISEEDSKIIVKQFSQNNSGYMSFKAINELEDLAESVNITVISNGFSSNQETQKIVSHLINKVTKPMLFEDDEILRSPGDLQNLKERSGDTVLALNLKNLPEIDDPNIAKPDQDKVSILQRLSADLDSIIVLNGDPILIGHPNGIVCINPGVDGGRRIADIHIGLPAVIAAVFGLGANLEESVKTGVYIYRQVRNLAIKESGGKKMIIQDIPKFIEIGMKYYRDNYDYIYKRISSLISIV
ncbi:NAD(P)H-hydrate epimerase [bacterium]|nr:NAD(P)H-hydrate epimerase [bacterium]